LGAEAAGVSDGGVDVAERSVSFDPVKDPLADGELPRPDTAGAADDIGREHVSLAREVDGAGGQAGVGGDAGGGERDARDHGGRRELPGPAVDGQKMALGIEEEIATAWEERPAQRSGGRVGRAGVQQRATDRPGLSVR
jgi:hypothetical protein